MLDYPIRPSEINDVHVSEESDAVSEREDPQESRKVVVRKFERRPCQEGVCEHNVNHISFRSWCSHCVKGMAVNQGHSRRTDASDVPIVSIDYAYVNEDGEDRKKRKERERRGEEAVEGESRGMPVIVICDSNSKYMAAEVVPEKGVN